MICLYAVLKDNRLIYQSSDEEKTRHVAAKTDGDFCRIYIYPGGELTTFNLEPRSIEESHNYINRLVACVNHMRDLNRELNYQFADMVAQMKHRTRVVEKLKNALSRKTAIHESELKHLLNEADNVTETEQLAADSGGSGDGDRWTPAIDGSLEKEQ